MHLIYNADAISINFRRYFIIIFAHLHNRNIFDANHASTRPKKGPFFGPFRFVKYLLRCQSQSPPKIKKAHHVSNEL